MHSHQNTLLSKLGFQDSDRKLPEHDAACRYLAQENVAARFVQQLRQVKFEDGIVVKYRPKYGYDVLTAECKKVDESSQVEASTEYPIVKGRDEYRTTIGFVDVRIVRTSEATYRGSSVERYVDKVTERRLRDPKLPDFAGCGPWEDHTIGKCVKFVPHNLKDTRVARDYVGIEVKAGRINASEVIRQIRLYSQYLPGHTWVLVPLSDIAANEKTQIEREGIRVVKLGADFQRFLESERTPAQTEVFQ